MTPAPRTRRRRSPCRASTTAPWRTCRSACSASVARPTYDDLVREQVGGAVERAGGTASDDDLAALLAGSDTWTVG